MSAVKGHLNEGPSWLDVMMFIKDVEKTHRVFITVSMYVRTDEQGRWGMEWSIKSFSPRADLAETHNTVIHKRFPCTDHKTVPGLLYNLVTRLDAKIHAASVWKGAGEGLPF